MPLPLLITFVLLSIALLVLPFFQTPIFAGIGLGAFVICAIGYHVTIRYVDVPAAMPGADSALYKRARKHHILADRILIATQKLILEIPTRVMNDSPKKPAAIAPVIERF